MFKRIFVLCLISFCGFFSVIIVDCFAVTKGKLDQAQQKIISLIESGDYANAESTTAQLVDQYSGDPNLPEALYSLTERYENQQRFEETKRVYQQIVQKYPNSPYANRARLGISREEVLSFIISRDYDKAQQALDKLNANFAKHPDLPDTLYWIAERYRWSNRFNDANVIYRQIIQKHPDTAWTGKARLSISTENVSSLISSEKYNQAKDAFDKMAADFSGHQDFPETACWIAGQYEWNGRFEEANSVYQQIIQKYPDNKYAGNAKVGALRAKAMSLVTSKDFDKAKATLAKLVTDFPGHPDLTETLYRVGEKYEWSDRFEDAKGIYRQAVQGPSENLWSRKARLSISRAQVKSFITEGEYNKANEAIDKMMADFAGNPDLPETAYWIAEKYKWSDRSDESSRICRLIVQKFPGSQWAERAKFGISRADAMTLSMTQNYDQAQKALDKLTVDFSGNPDLPDTLYWIAEKYKWSFNFAQAKRVYQKLIEKYPGSVYESNAKLAIAGSDVLSLVMSQEYDNAEEALARMKVDFAENSDLPGAMMVIGEQFYKEGLAKDINGLEKEAKPLLETSVKIWDDVVNTYPKSKVVAETCCWAGDCYQKLCRYQDSLRCFQRIVDNYPDYMYAWHALFMVGRNYERLKDSGLISESDANPKIRAAYTQVLEKYPACAEAGIAREWIDRNNSK